MSGASGLGDGGVHRRPRSTMSSPDVALTPMMGTVCAVNGERSGIFTTRRGRWHPQRAKAATLQANQTSNTSD